MADEEAKIRTAETEMAQIYEVGNVAPREVRREVNGRLEFLAKVVGESSKKVTEWNREQVAHKKAVKLEE